MDHFGISVAMKGIAHVYFQTARRSGRTSQMLANLKNGDLVVCCNPRETSRLQRLCRERHLDVEVITNNPANVHELMDRGTVPGRMIFDHTWVEHFFLAALDQCAKDIAQLQDRLSGWGEAHEATRVQAFEISRWGPR
jgi:hypothetical protein